MSGPAPATRLAPVLRSLRLTGMLETLEPRLAEARAGKLGHAEFSYGTACQAPRIACATADSGRDGPKARRANRTEQSAGSPPG